MYGFRKHRSQATAQPYAGMTCFLKPALTLVKPSLLCHSSQPPMSFQPRCPCHSCRGMWGERNLWVAGYRTGIYGRRFKRQKLLMDGLTSHRSHATAQSCVGMTYLLKPARQILSFYDNHFMTKCVYLQRKNSKQV